jgi:hypothetical protein
MLHLPKRLFVVLLGQHLYPQFSHILL